MERLRGHRLAEERSLALHREVAKRLAEDPSILEVARTRVASWLQTGSVAPEYAARWREILNLPPSGIARMLTDPGEEARALRQVTPFAGIIPPRERWRIWSEVAARPVAP